MTPMMVIRQGCFPAFTNRQAELRAFRELGLSEILRPQKLGFP